MKEIVQVLIIDSNEIKVEKINSYITIINVKYNPSIVKLETKFS